MLQLRAQHAIDELKRQAEEASSQLREQAKKHADGVEQRERESRQRLAQERQRAIEERLSLIEKCVQGGQSLARNLRIGIASVMGCMAFISVYLGTSQAWWFAGAAIAGAVGIASFWTYPEAIFGNLIRTTRESRFDALLNEYKLVKYAHYFRVDWDTGEVRQDERTVLTASDSVP